MRILTEPTAVRPKTKKHFCFKVFRRDKKD
jgi:hypothetical protein